jgi:hypothetical protein
MADHQLPAYLQNRQVEDFTDHASDGLGGMLPPHVSIQGNVFTLIDATGQEFQPMQIMDAVIVDRSTVTCKRFYPPDRPWTPNSDEPPTCWSSNGVGPSKEAVAPQARTCAECQWNVRGSAVSKISGAAIKACRDEYLMAILLPSMPNMMFQFVLTPGSFDNWQGYTAKFKNSNVRISMVVTRMAFQPKVNGVVTFESTAYIDEATNNLVQKALLEKATDVLCGRLDTPRVAGIAAPVQMQQIQPEQAIQQPRFVPAVQPQQSIQQPLSAMTPTVPAATNASPPVSEPAPVQRRRRRTAAEMAAANSGATAPTNGAGGIGTPIPVPSAAPQAPFPHAAPQTSTPVPPNNFGIQQGQPAAANPELATMLDDWFSKG